MTLSGTALPPIRAVPEIIRSYVCEGVRWSSSWKNRLGSYCRTLLLQLADGITHPADCRFKLRDEGKNIPGFAVWKDDVSKNFRYERVTVRSFRTE